MRNKICYVFFKRCIMSKSVQVNLNLPYYLFSVHSPLAGKMSSLDPAYSSNTSSYTPLTVAHSVPRLPHPDDPFLPHPPCLYGFIAYPCTPASTFVVAQSLGLFYQTHAARMENLQSELLLEEQRGLQVEDQKCCYPFRKLPPTN